MNSSETLEVFRQTVGDTEAPYLWSDTEAYRYMNDAQNMFCRLTGGLGDGSSALTRVSYTTSDDWVMLDKRILKVRDATFLNSGRQVVVLSMEDMRASDLRFDSRPGHVRRMVLGIEPAKARLHPYPSEAGTLQLIVDRLPLKAITDAGDQKFEIDEQHHLALVTWMQHRAYSKQDADTFDRLKAAEHEAAFQNYCFEAKAERERAGGKVRVVNYGGI